MTKDELKDIISAELKPVADKISLLLAAVNGLQWTTADRLSADARAQGDVGKVLAALDALSAGKSESSENPLLLKLVQLMAAEKQAAEWAENSDRDLYGRKKPSSPTVAKALNEGRDFHGFRKH